MSDDDARADLAARIDRAEAAGRISKAEAAAHRDDLAATAPPALDGRRVAFAGRFAFGPQSACAAATRAAGGIPGRLTRTTDLLVTGATRPAPDAVRRAAANGIPVIDEAEWRRAIDKTE